MKKTLLSIFTLLSVSIAAAQSKSTGTVTLSTNSMTAELELNNATTTATLTLTGPSDRWFALQFGSFANGQGMQAGQDVVYFNGTTLIDAVMNGIGAAPVADTNNWTVTSNTVSGGTRTIVATRAFTGGTNDYNFSYSDESIDFAWAHGNGPSYAMSYHGGARGYAFNNELECAPPDAPIAMAQTFCDGATVANLSATGGANAAFNWYLTAAGGVALASTSELNSGTYYVSQTISACESNRVPVTVTVIDLEEPEADNMQEVCTDGTIADLEAEAQVGAQLFWYTSATGGTPLANNTILTSGTYYVGQSQGDCESARQQVMVNVTTLQAPEAEASQSVCEGSTLEELEATETGSAEIMWYTDLGGEPLEEETVVATGTYYAVQTLGECESAPTEVTVMVMPAPEEPDGLESQEFTAGETVSSLEISVEPGAEVEWYILVDGEYVDIDDDTPLVNGTTYYVSQEVNDCESDFLAITVQEVLSAGNFTIKDFLLYPNPANNVVTVTANEPVAEVYIYNLLGQQVSYQKVEGATLQLTVSQLAPGNYILKAIAKDGNTATAKLVKN